MKALSKLSAIAMIVMGVAGASHAAVPSNHATNNNSVWSPHFNGWFIGVDGLDLRPENGDLDYVTFFPASPNGGMFNTQRISPDYQWSWRLYGGIKFTDNDDITLSWMSMRDDNHSSVGSISTAGSAPRWLPVESGSPDSWTNISSKVTFHLDDAYGVWGHTINFNNPWSVRYAGGLEYAKLDSNLSVNADDFNDPTLVGGSTAISHLKGFGPRAEFDVTYHLPYNFAIFANTNAALLSSTRKVSLNPNGNFTDADFISLASTYSTRHVVIPKVGVKLGVSYGYIFGQSGGEGGGSCTTLTVDAGWQAESYVHAIERPEDGFVSGGITLAPNQVSSGGFATTKTSNFNDQGLFVGVKISSDWL